MSYDVSLFFDGNDFGIRYLGYVLSTNSMKSTLKVTFESLVRVFEFFGFWGLWGSFQITNVCVSLWFFLKGRLAIVPMVMDNVRTHCPSRKTAVCKTAVWHHFSGIKKGQENQILEKGLAGGVWRLTGSKYTKNSSPEVCPPSPKGGIKKGAEKRSESLT